MKGTTATGSLGTGLVVAWIWNSFVGWFFIPDAPFPEMGIDAAGGIALLLLAAASRFLDGLE